MTHAELQGDLFPLPSIGGAAERPVSDRTAGRERLSIPLGMTHRDGLATEREAAARVLPRLTELHQAVLQVLQVNGPLNDRELERLPCFSHCGPSTVRKRRSELYKAGRLEAFGKRDGLTVWRIATNPPRQDQEPA